MLIGLTDEDMAGLIRSYWAHRGFAVSTRVEPSTEYVDRRGALMLIRSDMKNGLPKGWRRSTAILASLAR